MSGYFDPGGASVPSGYVSPPPSVTRQRLLVLGLVVLVAGLGFSAGAFFGPERVETRDVERLVYRDLTVEDLTRGLSFVRTETRIVNRDVVTVVTVTPDAGTTTTITDRSVERSGDTEERTEHEEHVVYRDRDVVRDVETTKTVTVRPDWGVGALVGATWKEPALQLGNTPLVVGVTVERRIIGGVWVGAWGTTQGAGGLLLKGEF